MVDHVSHEYRQVARHLGVKPEAILTADQDLVVFLQRCWLAQAAKGLNLLMPYKPGQEAEALIASVTEYLLGRYGDGLLRQIRNEVRTKLESPRKDIRRSGQSILK